MAGDDIHLDEDGIPVLEARVAETAVVTPSLDPEQIRQLLQASEARQMLDDLTEDLQQTVLWKLEAMLKEEMGKVIQEALRQSAPRIQQDLHTQLELALPDLLASLVEKN